MPPLTKIKLLYLLLLLGLLIAKSLAMRISGSFVIVNADKHSISEYAEVVVIQWLYVKRYFANQRTNKSE
jgi:hypothetical protein